MAWETHTSLLEQLRTFSERSAWDCLAQEFHGPLVRFAERAGLTHDRAEDAAQETLVAFAEGYRGGRYDRTRGRLSSWLFGIARRQVQRARRDAALDPAHQPESPSVFLAEAEADGDELESLWEQEWQRSVLERCMRRVQSEVTPETWNVFRLLTFERLSSDAVASSLGIPRSRVYNAKHRVAARLREVAQELEDA